MDKQLKPENFDNPKEYQRLVRDIQVDILDDLHNAIRTFSNHNTLSKLEAVGDDVTIARFAEAYSLLLSVEEKIENDKRS